MIEKMVSAIFGVRRRKPDNRFVLLMITMPMKEHIAPSTAASLPSFQNAMNRPGWIIRSRRF